MKAHELAGLAAIAAAFAEPVAYTGAGLTGQQVLAVRSDTAGQRFQGPGDTVRQVTYEIQQATLPGEPSKYNMIEDALGLWKVIDITRRDDIAAWVLVVEEADA